VVLAAAVLAGCNLIFGVDDLGPAPGAAGGSAGEGGAAPAGAGPGGGPCASAEDCPKPEIACHVRVCLPEGCGVAPEAPGPSAMQTAGDCRETVCDELGTALAVVDDADLPDDGDDCTLDVCLGGYPTHRPRELGDACPGGRCDATGACVACIEDADCVDPAKPSTECRKNVCESGACTLATFPESAVSMQTKGDCKTVVCTDQGDKASSTDASDVPDDGNPCTKDSCMGGSPSHQAVPNGTLCVSTILSCDSGACPCFGSICSADAGPCRYSLCKAGLCSYDPVPKGQVLAPAWQTPGNCQRLVCDGDGHVVPEPDDADVSPSGGPCSIRSCSDGAVLQYPAPLHTACPAGYCDGKGWCLGCTKGSQCPAGGPCTLAVCEDGRCALADAPMASLAAEQPSGDCKVRRCDGKGASYEEADDGDVPADDENECTAELCSLGVPAHPPMPSGTPCGPAGTGKCDGKGACIG
jgi:hypothetical protein